MMVSMSWPARILGHVLALLALSVMLIMAPGGICLCADRGAAADRSATDDCGGCESEKQPTGHDCGSGCQLVCCAHPVVVPAVAPDVLGPEAPSSRLTSLPAARLETAGAPPRLPPPRA